MNQQNIITCIIVTLSISLLNGCTTTIQDSPPTRHIDVSKITNAKPKKEVRSLYGNPPYYDVFGKRYYVLNSSKNYHATGIASWYGMKFNGQPTSSREPYNVFKMTAAHRTLPIPCYVKVTNLENGKQVIVKVNDRGPFASNRIIDLSYVAAKKLGIVAHGTAMVKVDAINPTSKTHYYIQVGAYSKLAHAKQMRKYLATKVTKLPNLILPLKQKDHILYRVQLGPINNLALANNITNKLKTAKTVIIQR
jgi:rare lipoprotein A